MKIIINGQQLNESEAIGAITNLDFSEEIKSLLIRQIEIYRLSEHSILTINDKSVCLEWHAPSKLLDKSSSKYSKSDNLFHLIKRKYKSLIYREYSFSIGEHKLSIIPVTRLVIISKANNNFRKSIYFNFSLKKSYKKTKKILLRKIRT